MCCEKTMCLRPDVLLLSTLVWYAPAALVGYVEYPVVALASGLAPLSTLDGNATMLLDACIVPGTGPARPVFSGRLVRLFAYPASGCMVSCWALLSHPRFLHLHARGNSKARICLVTWAHACAVRCH